MDKGPTCKEGKKQPLRADRKPTIKSQKREEMRDKINGEKLNGIWNK
jgi:hypothetical protein